jgi:hypothetical protein
MSWCTPNYNMTASLSNGQHIYSCQNMSVNYFISKNALESVFFLILLGAKSSELIHFKAFMFRKLIYTFPYRNVAFFGIVLMFCVFNGSVLQLWRLFRPIKYNSKSSAKNTRIVCCRLSCIYQECYPSTQPLSSFLSEFALFLEGFHILFQYCYKYCYSDSRNLWAVMKAGGLAL